MSADERSGVACASGIAVAACASGTADVSRAREASASQASAELCVVGSSSSGAAVSSAVSTIASVTAGGEGTRRYVAAYRSVLSGVAASSSALVSLETCHSSEPVRKAPDASGDAVSLRRGAESLVEDSDYYAASSSSTASYTATASARIANSGAGSISNGSKYSAVTSAGCCSSGSIVTSVTSTVCE